VLIQQIPVGHLGHFAQMHQAVLENQPHGRPSLAQPTIRELVKEGQEEHEGKTQSPQPGRILKF